MTIPAGWAEFNDVTAKLRGVMVAGKGTFSGTFTADSIDAINSINIRDGAVSRSYGFQTARTTGQPLLAMDFTIPAQPYLQIVEVIVPALYVLPGTGSPMFYLYRNGVLVDKQAGPRPPGGILYYGKQEGGAQVTAWYIDTPIRFTDWEADKNSPITYQVRVDNGQYVAQIWGTAFVMCRMK